MEGETLRYLRRGIMHFLESWWPKISGEVLDGVGTWDYSRKLFTDVCQYTATDWYECPNIDIVSDIYTLEITFGENRYDFALCTDVPELVIDLHAAAAQLYRVLKPGGTLLMTTPFNYHMHTAPHVEGYWRFTEAGLRILLKDFAQVAITPNGYRKFPHGHCTVATK